jgi:hypothetical protein
LFLLFTAISRMPGTQRHSRNSSWIGFFDIYLWRSVAKVLLLYPAGMCSKIPSEGLKQDSAKPLCIPCLFSLCTGLEFSREMDQEYMYNDKWFVGLAHRIRGWKWPSAGWRARETVFSPRNWKLQNKGD